MVVAYLNSLTSMTNVDKALEQTISFSLHHLVDRLRDIQLLQNDQTQSEDLSSKMSNLRSWLWNLQDNPLGNIKNVSDPSWFWIDEIRVREVTILVGVFVNIPSCFNGILANILIAEPGKVAKGLYQLNTIIGWCRPKLTRLEKFFQTTMYVFNIWSK